MTKIMTSLNEVKKYSSESDFRCILSSKNKTEADDELFPMSDIFDAMEFYDVKLVLAPLNENVRIKYFLWCARRVQHLMDDQRSIDALDIAWRYSEGEANEEELLDANQLADEAYRDAIKFSDPFNAESAADCAFVAAISAVFISSKTDNYSDLADTLLNSAAHAFACAQLDDADSAGDEYRENCDLEIEAQTEKLRQILDTGEWVND